MLQIFQNLFLAITQETDDVKSGKKAPGFVFKLLNLMLLTSLIKISFVHLQEPE